jgi:hypothetical protein
VASERQNARDIAALRQGPAPSVSGPPVIESQIKSGVATADLLAALDALGIIADQTTFGDDGVAAVQDDALLPSTDRQTVIDGAVPVFSGETNDWEPVTQMTLPWLTITGLLTYGRDGSPTYTKLTAMGTTGAVNTSSGGSTHGEMAFTPGGTGIAAGAQAQINFGVTFASTAYDLIIIPRNAAAGGILWYTATRGTSAVSFASTTALVSGTLYAISYVIVG